MIALLLSLSILIQSAHSFSAGFSLVKQKTSILIPVPTHRRSPFQALYSKSDEAETATTDGGSIEISVDSGTTTATASKTISEQEKDKGSSEDYNLAQEIMSKVNTTESAINSSPPLSFRKYITMQEKRVQVTIRFSAIPGLRPYYLTIAKKIKESNSDVFVEKVVLPTAEDAVIEDTVFEVLIDGKAVVGKSRGKFQNVRRTNNVSISENKVYGMSVYVSMEDVNVAIGKARKKRRPSTTGVYTPEDRARSIGLEMLKRNDEK